MRGTLELRILDFELSSPGIRLVSQLRILDSVVKLTPLWIFGHNSGFSWRIQSATRPNWIFGSWGAGFVRLGGRFGIRVGGLGILGCGVTLDVKDASAGFQLWILDFGLGVAKLEF